MQKFSTVITIGLLFSSVFAIQADATAMIENSVGDIEVEQHEEMTMVEKMEILTEVALKYEIPPEILKAIALVESDMMQFKDGEPLITDDGGIGIMQVTNTELEVNEERLKYDTAYNIEIGAQILKSKWNLQFHGRIPTINDGKQGILENWYFAIMAYNGLSIKNDPNQSEDTYQERVYRELEKYSQIEVADFPPIHIMYNGYGTMAFPDKQLYWESATTESTQMFVPGDRVYVMNSLDPHIYPYANMRNEPSLTSAVSNKLAYYTELEIIGGPYIGSSSRFNQFAMYKVKGTDLTGYIASSNLRRVSTESVFKQWDEMQTTDVQKKWTIQLNQPVHPELVSSRNVYIIDESGNGVFTHLTYHKEDSSIIVKPEKSFNVGKSYSLVIKDLQSLSNHLLKDNTLMPFTIIQ